MKKLITSLICFFACAGLQARITLHQSDFDQKSLIEPFSENTPESHQVQKLYLIETASGELLILAENRASGKYRARYFDTNLGRFISRDPLGYVDGMGLYNGYFAGGFNLDPSGLYIIDYDTGWYIHRDFRKKCNKSNVSKYGNVLKRRDIGVSVWIKFGDDVNDDDDNFDALIKWIKKKGGKGAKKALKALEETTLKWVYVKWEAEFWADRSDLYQCRCMKDGSYDWVYVDRTLENYQLGTGDFGWHETEIHDYSTDEDKWNDHSDVPEIDDFDFDDPTSADNTEVPYDD